MPAACANDSVVDSQHDTVVIRRVAEWEKMWFDEITSRPQFPTLNPQMVSPVAEVVLRTPDYQAVPMASPEAREAPTTWIVVGFEMLVTFDDASSADILKGERDRVKTCLLYTSPSPRDS